jgi:hypothetical protein
MTGMLASEPLSHTIIARMILSCVVAAVFDLAAWLLCPTQARFSNPLIRPKMRQILDNNLPMSSKANLPTLYNSWTRNSSARR